MLLHFEIEQDKNPCELINGGKGPNKVGEKDEGGGGGGLREKDQN